MMEFKRVDLLYIDRVMIIINQAKDLLKGESMQWQNGYPNEETLREDIAKGDLFGLFDKGELIGICALKKGIDANYLHIQNGEWNLRPSTSDLVIHRVAISKTHHGEKLGYTILIDSINKAREMGCNSVKIDTHKNNLAMRQIIREAGFNYKGVVEILSEQIDNKRLAYELDF